MDMITDMMIQRIPITTAPASSTAILSSCGSVRFSFRNAINRIAGIMTTATKANLPFSTPSLNTNGSTADASTRIPNPPVSYTHLAD